MFSLYWFLEGLSLCNVKKSNSAVLEIVKQTIKFNDYTIREKTAKILNKLDNVSQDLLKIAKEDQNFYVKNFCSNTVLSFEKSSTVSRY